MAAGDFTASQALNVQAKLEELFSGARFSANLNKPIPVAIATAQKQTASFLPVMVGNNCIGVEVRYLKDSISVNDSNDTEIDSCDINGDELESAKKTLTATEDLWTEFTVWDDECKDLFDARADKLAFGMARAMVELELLFNNKQIAFFHANTMTPVIRDGDGILDGDIITVPTDTLNTADYLAIAHAIAQENDVYDPFILSGRTFFIDAFKAKFKTAACCSIDSIFDTQFDISFDLKNFDQEIGAQSVLMVDPASYAVWFKNDITVEAPTLMASDTYVWKTPSPRLQFANGGTLQRVFFDVLMKRKCTITAGSPKLERWGMSVRIHLRYGVDTAPDPSGIGTGIIEFKAV